MPVLEDGEPAVRHRRSEGGSPPGGRGGRVLALVAISAADFLVVMEGFVVAVALPAMQDDLGLSQSGLQWVFTAYVLVFGGFLLLGGRVADLYGRRRVLIAGFGAFAAGSVVAGLAPTPGLLIAGRAVQGLGAAAMSPAALALLTATFPTGGARNMALGVWSAVGSVGIPAGALIGGLLTQVLGWRWVLALNAPAALLAAVLAWVTLEESRDETVRDADGVARLDVPGATTITAGLALLIVAITGTERLAAVIAADPWQAGEVAASGVGLLPAVAAVTVPLVAAGALLIGFVRIERRLERRGMAPLVPLSIVRTPGLVTADLAAAVLPVGLGALLLLGTQHLQRVLGFTAWQTGVAYLALAVPTIVASPAAARLTGRLGRRWVAIGGFALQAAGLLWLSAVAPEIGVAGAGASSSAFTRDVFLLGVLPAFVMVGAGAPIAYVPVTGAAVDDAGHAAGLASGLFNAAQQVGNALALALMATAVAIGAALAPGSPAANASELDLLAGLRIGLAVAAVLCITGAQTAWWLRKCGSCTPM